jgi:phage shock protein PspC (stress-responsive transcriptional regulator)
MAELAAYRMGFIAATTITATGAMVLAYLIFVVLKRPDNAKRLGT